MPALSQLLDRLRRVRLPPGPAAGAVAVPSAAGDLSVEVGFLFAELDAIHQRGEAIVAAARSEAAEIEARANTERHRLLNEARTEAERVVERSATGRRATSERRIRALLAEADVEAERVVSGGRERIPALVEEVLGRVLETIG